MNWPHIKWRIKKVKEMLLLVGLNCYSDLSSGLTGIPRSPVRSLRVRSSICSWTGRNQVRKKKKQGWRELWLTTKKTPQKQKQYTVKLNVTKVKQWIEHNYHVIVNSLRIKVNWKLLIQFLWNIEIPPRFLENTLMFELESSFISPYWFP